MKDSYYFSHDANASHDPKIARMMLELGSSGYGIYWVIIEMLRNEHGFKLALDSIDAIAYQSHSDQKLVERVIKNYDLFEIKDNMFWSDSLLRRMDKYAERCTKARNSANKRWNNANAMPTQCEGNALKERKVKERKENNKEPKRLYPEKIEDGQKRCVLLTDLEYQKLEERFGGEGRWYWIKTLNEGIQLKGYKYNNHYMAILKWAGRPDAKQYTKVKTETKEILPEEKNTQKGQELEETMNRRFNVK